MSATENDDKKKSNDHRQPQTYYDILELSHKSPSDVTPLDIKKAYRRLALRHHPDRNNGSDESKVRFQQIGHAYETLSDAKRKATYDACIAAGDTFDSDGHVVGGSGAGADDEEDNNVGQHHPNQPHRYNGRYHDAYTTFNDLFNNDPFFADAFEEMDEEFFRRFQEGQTAHGPNHNAAAATDSSAAPLSKLSTAICGVDLPRDIKTKGGFGPWLLDKMGVQLTVTTYKSDIDGNVSASAYTNADAASAYTDKRTRTYMKDRKRVTVKSMERDGNKIEDTYVEGVRKERRVNGVLLKSIEE